MALQVTVAHRQCLIDLPMMHHCLLYPMHVVHIITDHNFKFNHVCKSVTARKIVNAFYLENKRHISESSHDSIEFAMEKQTNYHCLILQVEIHFIFCVTGFYQFSSKLLNADFILTG
jgi:hypothetical protein